MNGKAERQLWQIFNNFEERAGSGIVPNSFFALRTKTKNATVVRALQTSLVGEFSAMDSLSFQGEFPLGGKLSLCEDTMQGQYFLFSKSRNKGI